MTAEQGFFVRLARLAKLCRFDLDEDAAGFYDGALSDLGYEKLNEALDQILLNRGSKDAFPSVREIRDIFSPSTTIDSAAQELLSRAIEASGIYGVYDTESVHKFLGDIAWKALPGKRGWEEFCMAGDTELGGIPVATCRAQLRDRLKALLQRENPTGRVCLPPPEIPKAKISFIHGEIEAPKQTGLTSIKDTLGLLVGHDNKMGK